MEAYDVVIAGGGPAGLAMAAPLAEAGLAVLVCERNADIARRAAPNFVPDNRLRDTAFWASVIGPLVGVGHWRIQRRGS